MIDDLGRGLKYNAIGKSITILCALAMSILLVRGLGKENYGLYVYTIGVFTLLSPLFDVGLTTPLIRYISEYRAKGEIGKIRKLIVTSIKLKCISWIILSPIILLVWYRLHPETFLIAVLLCLSMLLSSINNIFLYSLESFYEQKLLNITTITRNLFNIVLVLFIVLTMPGILMVILAGLIANILQLIQLGRRLNSLTKVSPASITNDRKRIAKYASSGMVSSIIALISYDKSEVVVLGTYRTEQEVAIYGLSYDLAMRIPNLIIMIIGSLHYVSFTELYTKNREQLRYGVEKFEKYIFMISIPICVWSFIEADALINMLYGKSMLDSVFPFRIIIIVMLINLSVFPINGIIAALEEQPIWTVIGGFFAAIKIGLNIFLIPRYGINGALFTMCFIYLFGSIIAIPWAHWKIGKFLPFKSIAIFLMSTIPLALILLLTKSFCTNIYLLGIISLVSFISYVTMLRITRALSYDDKRLLMKIDLPLLKEIVRQL